MNPPCFNTLLFVTLSTLVSASLAVSLGRLPITNEGALPSHGSTQHALQMEAMASASGSGAGDEETSPLLYSNEDYVRNLADPAQPIASPDYRGNAYATNSKRRARSTSGQCAEPSEDVLRSQLTAEEVFGESTGESATEIPHVYGSCPSSFLAGVLESLEDRALCPWTNQLDHDTARYPRDLVFAQCACPKCIEPTLNAYSSSLFQIGCQPVTKHHVVLRRGECVDGVYRYTPERLLLPVACVCAKSDVI